MHAFIKGCRICDAIGMVFRIASWVNKMRDFENLDVIFDICLFGMLGFSVADYQYF